MSENSPLEGIRVVDFTQVMLGPCATQLLGDFGADVVKIERPASGDLSRHSYPDRDGLDNPVFGSINRNKRSIALDVRSNEGREIIVRLIKECDVVVNNFRSGVMDRLGLGYEDVRAMNERVIYAEGTGFGTAGPLVHKGGQDVLAQAYTGVMWRRAQRELPLSIYATAVADFSAGMHLVQGILLALLWRERTGRGQRISVSLYDSLISAQMQEASVEMMRKDELNWAAMPLSGVFETKDSPIVVVGAFKQHPLRDICAALEIEDLSLDERFAAWPSLKENRSELHAIFRQRFASEGCEHWMKRLEDQDILCAPVQTLRQALSHPQTAANGMLLEFDHPVAGRFQAVAPPVHLSETPATVRRAAPRLGEHTDEILGALGFGTGDVERLRDAGVVG